MTKLYFDNDIPWCQGCGDFFILRSLDKAIEEAGIDRHKLVLVSGIGQASKLPHYTTANVFNGLHGRPIPAATAIKIANHELEVLVTAGDGDIYGEGGNHLVHAIRRNIGIKVLVHNNQVYGLTKGQASPTSEPGFVTSIQTHGVVNQPFNALAIAIVQGATFVARSYAGDPKHLQAMMLAALNHRGGFALLDILQPCPTYNRLNTYQWYRERVKPVDESHDPYHRAQALDLAFRWGDEIPIGVIYRCDRPTLESQLPALEKGTLVGQYA
jgi:2-oxoglutarate ferredoxin oxidoreductase subunit beta